MVELETNPLVLQLKLEKFHMCKRTNAFDKRGLLVIFAQVSQDLNCSKRKFTFQFFITTSIN
jgi:hypothetical protein